MKKRGGYHGDLGSNKQGGEDRFHRLRGGLLLLQIASLTNIGILVAGRYNAALPQQEHHPATNLPEACAGFGPPGR